ncbi:MAG: hypothetical protein ACFB2X_26190 [Rivularia sp. (in: cyanobacteria)]
MGNQAIPKVVRVDRYEFELDTGQVFQHVEPLETDVTVTEFQVFYEHWYKNIMEIVTDGLTLNDAANLEKAWCKH